MPRVGISYSYAGAHGVSDSEAKAIVVATTGFAPQAKKCYAGLRRKGVIVATTFPSGEEIFAVDWPSSGSDLTAPPVIGVKHLMPAKARILMMLTLTRITTLSDIQKIVDSY